MPKSIMLKICIRSDFSPSIMLTYNIYACLSYYYAGKPGIVFDAIGECMGRSKHVLSQHFYHDILLHGSLLVGLHVVTKLY